MPLLRYGEKAGEQPEYQRYGYHGEDEAGKYELVGNNLVAPGALGDDGSTGYGRHGGFKNYQQGDAVSRLDDEEDTEERQRENDVLDGQELDYFLEIEFTSLFEIQVKTAAEDNHDQGHGHAADNLQNRMYKVREVVPYPQKLNGHRQDGSYQDRVKNPVPLHSLFFFPFAEKEMIQTEKYHRVDENKDIKHRQIFAGGPEDAADDN